MFIVRCTRTNLIHFIGRVSFEKEDISYIPQKVYRTSEEKQVQTEDIDAQDENEATTAEEKGTLKNDKNKENENNNKFVLDDDDDEEF